MVGRLSIAVWLLLIVRSCCMLLILVSMCIVVSLCQILLYVVLSYYMLHDPLLYDPVCIVDSCQYDVLIVSLCRGLLVL